MCLSWVLCLKFHHSSSTCNHPITFERYINDYCEGRFPILWRFKNKYNCKGYDAAGKRLFFPKHLDINVIGSAWTDRASVLLGNKFTAEMKKKISNLQGTHNFLHCHTLTEKLFLCLKKVFDNCVKIINWITEFWVITPSNHFVWIWDNSIDVLFYTEVNWLSQGQSLNPLTVERNQFFWRSVNMIWLGQWNLKNLLKCWLTNRMNNLNKVFLLKDKH